MLKALLEPETWAAVSAVGGEDLTEPAREQAAQEPEGESEEPRRAEEVAAVAAAEPAAATSSANGATAQEEAVRDMLSGPEGLPPRKASRRAARVLAGTLGAAGLIAAAGFAGAALFGDDEPDRSESSSPTRHFKAQGGGPLAAPFPSDPGALRAGYLTAAVRGPTTLYDRPGGRRKVRLAARTESKSPRVMSVVEQRSRWLAVLAPELKNGEVGWLPAERAQVGSVRWSLHVDLSKRRLLVRKDGRKVRRMTIAVGSPQHSTPKGRFAVTDRLDVVDQGSPYGCCVLALTGHQTRLPADWPGGDRLAIHATTDTSSIGKAVSLGCMRTTSGQARWMIEKVPLGTPVFIRS